MGGQLETVPRELCAQSVADIRNSPASTSMLRYCQQYVGIGDADIRARFENSKKSSMRGTILLEIENNRALESEWSFRSGG